MSELRTTRNDQIPIQFHSAAGDLRQSLDVGPRSFPPRSATSAPKISEGDARSAQEALAELIALDSGTRAQVLDALDPATRAQVNSLLSLLETT